MIITRPYILNGGKHMMLAESGFRADGRCTEMSWELRGQVMLTSTFQPWVILANEVNPCGPQTRAWLITCWDEDWLGGNPIGTKGTSIVTKKFLYECVYKVKLESMFEQWLYRPTQAVVVVVFLHDKVFFQFLLRTPRFLLHSLS